MSDEKDQHNQQSSSEALNESMDSSHGQDSSSSMDSQRDSNHLYAGWVEALLAVAKHYRLEYSDENVRLTTAWSEGKPLGEVLRVLALQLGMTLKTEKLKENKLSPWRLPLVVQFNDGQVAVIKTISAEQEVGIAYSGDQGLNSSITQKELLDNASVAVVLRPAKAIPDSRVDDYIKPHKKNWLRKIVLRDIKPYGHIMLASLIANVLSLAGIFFSRQVYDRVIPAESMNTLYVLFSGVLLALTFDFIMRRSRLRITDLLGKRADMRASDRVFGHALRIKNTARPKSTGTFISQIRELEYVRELFTSTTVTAFADMPFFILFCFVFWYIAGSLVLVPIGALVLMIIPGLLVQRKLRRLANDSMRESSLRSAMLVESVQGIEDIKTLQAEPRFQNQWNHYNAVTADMNLRLRYVTNSLGVWSQTIQTGVFATVVFFGAPMVMSGDLTTGSLVAASILSSRMMSPMTQLTQVLSKWQQAKVATNSLNQIMERPVDNPEGSKRIQRSSIRGNYEFKQAFFKYNEEDRVPSLQVKQLTISAGERVAILGRNGAGKSTLLQACSGLLEPQSGEVLLDGVRLDHIDPADVRRDVGLLSQNSRLFHGTIRENLLLGAPNATDQELIDAINMSGAHEIIRKLPDGLDHIILEGGLGLSGGQRQSLLLSRLMIRQPKILMLDEPTASLDETTEKWFIKQLKTWLPGKMLIVATHRLSILELVDRVVVVDQGRIVMDDTKDKVIAQLSGKPAKPPRSS
ncbi:type I secretion system permease/ATPase [Halomonas sp. SpR8]|uniref:type I secretion system permease/ATPase n=1 Tax=Halomonas sp. SpR8 TaxID=3050463 RepID=UPI0027E3D5A4|nr:type I secretion system permease/ATPase [Halomonas sp. SpR8]MDQ7730980.1 type I secretion system permease/ATPase [Halomonas sp. SpR8]